MSPAAPHIPVMAEQVLDALQVHPGGAYCDATVGFGGHAEQILLRSAPDGQLAGIDRDPDALAEAAERLSCFGARARLRRGNFADVVEHLARLGLTPVDGVLVDLGVSSAQLDRPERGFSLAADGPLDMRMDPDSAPSAAGLIAGLSEAELAHVIFEYGEERASRRIARAIKRALEQGQLRGTADLARVVAAANRGRGPRSSSPVHPATRTFQALRIAVNDELGALERFLDRFTDVLRPGGRVAVIAFHSLEDRVVKQRFAQLADPCTCPPQLPRCVCGARPILTLVARKPLRPGAAEIARNPRARSARLRVAERLS